MCDCSNEEAVFLLKTGLQLKCSTTRTDVDGLIRSKGHPRDLVGVVVCGEFESWKYIKTEVSVENVKNMEDVNGSHIQFLQGRRALYFEIMIDLEQWRKNREVKLS